MNAGMERLPWLVEPSPAPMSKRRPRGLSRWIVLSLLLLFVGAAGLLAIVLPMREPMLTPTTLTRPLPMAVPAAPAVEAATLPPVANSTPEEAVPVAPPIPIAPARATPRTEAAARPSTKANAAATSSEEEPAATAGGRTVFPADEAPAALPPLTGPRPIILRQLQPVRGRIVQLGPFASPTAADSFWRNLAVSYPYLAAKPKMVSPLDIRDPQTGRTTRMYRLQLATASQAQSAVICQQLVKAWRNCTVVY
jgi:hypothetical protein